MDSTKLLNLSISTRVISQLGEQLISDEMVALMELIKNAYDADATNVIIEVDTKAQTSQGIGKITITDNGNGMTPYIIENSFLRISTGFKGIHKISPYYKRLVLGEKGLGRLAFNRLGRYVTVETTPRIERIDQELVGNLEGFNKFKICMDWESLAIDKDFNKIQAKLERETKHNLTYGTEISIEGIKNINFWNLDKTQRQRLKSEIFGMINPFTKNKESKFEIYLYIDGEKFTTEEIDEDLIEKISDVSTKFSLDENFILNIEINRKEKYIDNRIKKDNSKNANQGTSLKLVEKNIDAKLKKETYMLDLKDIQKLKKEFPKLGEIQFDLIKNKIAFPGKFHGAIYAADFASKASIVKNLNAENIKTTKDLDNLWEQTNGVFVFRNEFRILPYGKKDWLDFTKRSQRLKSNIYREHTIAGYINLDGQSSENLKEQTNRQGFIEDEYGNNFFKIVRDIIAELIVRKDIELREGFDINIKPEQNYVYTKNKMVLYKIERTIQQEKEDKKQELEKILNKTGQEETKKVVKEYLQIERKSEKEHKQEKEILQREIEEIKDIAPMVGQAIIVESMTHELNRIEGNIKQYSKDSLDIAYKIEDTFENKNSLIKNQRSILDETVYLRAQLNHLEPTYRSKKNMIELIDMKELLMQSYKINGPMSIKAKNNNVEINIIGKNFEVEANRGYLITIFDNLFLNSLHWVNFSNKEQKEITFEVKENKEIIIWDSGDGIHEDIEETLFNPFTTMKKEGRGLGLYIVQELLQQMNAKIELDKERKDGRLYKFHIYFNNQMEE